MISSALTEEGRNNAHGAGYGLLDFAVGSDLRVHLHDVEATEKVRFADHLADGEGFVQRQPPRYWCPRARCVHRIERIHVKADMERSITIWIDGIQCLSGGFPNSQSIDVIHGIVFDAQTVQNNFLAWVYVSQAEIGERLVVQE